MRRNPTPFVLLALAACDSKVDVPWITTCDTADGACDATTTDPWGTQTGAATGSSTGSATGSATGTATGITSAIENCTDGTDNDGDGDSDCQDPDCRPICDADGDNHIDEAMGGDDCDDGDASVYPGVLDDCDGVDNDCVGGVDGDSDGDAVGVCNDCDDADAAIYPGAVDACDGVDSDCDLADCSMFVEDFELGAPVAPFTMAGLTGWVVQSTMPHGGVYGFANGDISDSQTSRANLVVTFGAPGTVSFWHAGSTEVNYDYLKFYVDGVVQQQWSGSWTWTYGQFNVAAGVHTIGFEYYKDISVSSGSDTVWVDDLTIVGGAP